MGYRRHAVRDDKHRMFTKALQRSRYGRFVAGVERTGGFVQQQDRSTLEQGAREADPLSFASGKPRTSLADLGVPSAQPFDDLVDARRLRRGIQLLFAGFRPGDADVVENGALDRKSVV